MPLLFLLFFYANSRSLPIADLADSHAAKNTFFKGMGSATETLRMNMYAFAPSGTPFLVDGTFTRYSPDYSNSVDGKDARKMTNPGENIGMLRDNITIMIESRQIITLADTIFFKMWGMQKKTYQMQFVPTNLNHPGLQFFLEDNYLHSSTPLNLTDTTKITFAISNDAASSAMYRFRVIFKTIAPVTLPFSFTNVNAYPENNHVIVEWKTQNESNLNKYVVEKSARGKSFIDEAPVNAQNLSGNSYQWVDENPVQGNNYYRVRGIGMDGKIEYSDVMRVYAGKVGQGITAYPNPATVDNLNLQLNMQQAGLYEIQLINTFGQTLMGKKLNYKGGNGNEKINLGRSIPRGIYQLEIKTPGGEKEFISVVF